MMEKGGRSASDASREIINAQASKSLPKTMMITRVGRGRYGQRTSTSWRSTTRPESSPRSSATNGPRMARSARTSTATPSFATTATNRDRLPLTTFRSAVPGRAGTDPESLWKWLADYEKDTGGQVLAIPHNGNMSNGEMFHDTRYDGSPLTPEWASERSRWEVLVEIFQYKGQPRPFPDRQGLDRCVRQVAREDLRRQLVGRPHAGPRWKASCRRQYRGPRDGYLQEHHRGAATDRSVQGPGLRSPATRLLLRPGGRDSHHFHDVAAAPARSELDGPADLTRGGVRRRCPYAAGAAV